MAKYLKNNTIIITVDGGVSAILHAPDDINVLIVDYDDLSEDSEGYCPACGDCVEFDDDGVCSECGFNINNPMKILKG